MHGKVISIVCYNGGRGAGAAGCRLTKGYVLSFYLVIDCRYRLNRRELPPKTLMILCLLGNTHTHKTGTCMLYHTMPQTSDGSISKVYE